MTHDQVMIAVDGETRVSGLWMAPEGARTAYVFAHGAGAGMAHKSMTAIAEGLAVRGVATLRFNFLYMERGLKRPDAPALAHAAVRAAVNETRRLAPELALFAGGKSFGGRMTSQAQAVSPLPHVRGLVFFAFPLHPAGKPGDERARHLGDVALPMLFLQGANDALASLDLLRPVVARLGARATLHVVDHADHSFHVPAKSGRNDAEVLAEILDAAVQWMARRSG
jgi:predicted alpha/beta-hydrolase family hydrolase